MLPIAYLVGVAVLVAAMVFLVRRPRGFRDVVVASGIGALLGAVVGAAVGAAIDVVTGGGTVVIAAAAIAVPIGALLAAVRLSADQRDGTDDISA